MIIKLQNSFFRKYLFLVFLVSLVSVIEISAQINLPFPSNPTQSTKPYNVCAVVRPRHSRYESTEKREAFAEPILEAVYVGNLEGLNKLLTEGINPNTTGENGITALILAAGYQDLAMVNLLLNFRANPNLQVAGNGTALMSAAGGKCIKITERLIKAGADVNAKSTYQYTALFNAANANNFEAVKILTDSDADLFSNESASGERSPFIAAVKLNNIEMVKFILAKDTQKKLVSSFDAALFYAVSNASIEMLNFLISRGVDVNKNSRSGSILTTAAMRGNPEIIKILLNVGANPNIKGYETAAPLTWASNYGHIDAIKLLIAAHADVNIKDDWSPLITAARNERTEVMDILLKAGANINQRAYDGKTALMYASWQGKLKSVKLLIENNADMNLRDDNLTALSLAMKSNLINPKQIQDEIIQLLKNAGAIE